MPQRDLSRCEGDPAENWHRRDGYWKTSSTPPHSAVPTCMKAASITPHSQSPAATGLYDCTPEALTLIVMKCSKRLVMSHLKNSLDITVLSGDFTSALIIPETLRHKLHTLGLSPLCNWTLDFLSNRPQSFRVHNQSKIHLSPLLFTLLT